MPLNIYILRHAESEKNYAKDNFSQDQSVLTNKDSKLSQRGHAQALSVANYFNAGQIQIDAIYSSKLTRGVQTANIINDHLTKQTQTLVEPLLYNKEDVESSKLKAILSDFVAKSFARHMTDQASGNIIYITHNHIIEAFHALYVTASPHKYKTNNCNLSHIKLTKSDHELLSEVEFWCQEVI